MKKNAYITLAASAVLFVLLLALWLGGLVFAIPFGGFIHLLLLATIIPIIGFIVGLILLIVSFTKK